MKKTKIFIISLLTAVLMQNFVVMAAESEVITTMEAYSDSIALNSDSTKGWYTEILDSGDVVRIKEDSNGKYLELTRSAVTGNRFLKRTFSNVTVTDSDKIKLSFKAYFGIYPTGASTGTGNYKDMFLGIRTTGTNKAKLYNGSTNSTNAALWWFSDAPDYDTWVNAGKPTGYTDGSGVEFGNYSWFSQETMWHSFEYEFDFENRYYTITVDGNQVVNIDYNGTKFLVKDDFMSDLESGTNLEFVWSLGGAITDETNTTQTIGVRDFKIEKAVPKVEFGTVTADDFSTAASLSDTKWENELIEGDTSEIKDSALMLTRGTTTGVRSLIRNLDDITVEAEDTLKIAFDAYFGKYPTGSITPSKPYLFLGFRSKTNKSNLLYNGETDSNGYAYISGAVDIDSGETGGSGLEFAGTSSWTNPWFSYNEEDPTIPEWHSFEYTINFKEKYYTFKVDGNQATNRLYGGYRYQIPDAFYKSIVTNKETIQFKWALTGAMTGATSQTIGIRNFSVSKDIGQIKNLSFEKTDGFSLKSDDNSQQQLSDWNITTVTSEAVEGEETVEPQDTAEIDSDGAFSFTRDTAGNVRTITYDLGNTFTSTGKYKIEFSAYFGPVPEGVTTDNGTASRFVNLETGNGNVFYRGGRYINNGSQVFTFANMADYKLATENENYNGSDANFLTYTGMEYDTAKWHNFVYVLDMANRKFTATVDGKPLTNKYERTEYYITDDFYNNISSGLKLVSKSAGEITDENIQSETIKFNSFKIYEITDNFYSGKTTFVPSFNSNNAVIIIAEYSDNGAKLENIVYENIGSVKNGYIKEYTTSGSVEIQSGNTYKLMLWNSLSPILNYEYAE